MDLVDRFFPAAKQLQPSNEEEALPQERDGPRH